MQRKIEDFLRREIVEMHKNIDRIQNHIFDERRDSVPFSGQSQLLKIQQENLAVIETLSEKVQGYDEFVSYCRQQVHQSEVQHQSLARRENDAEGRHSDEWWNSLHRIQFWVDLLNRSKDWHDA